MVCVCRLVRKFCFRVVYCCDFGVRCLRSLACLVWFWSCFDSTLVCGLLVVMLFVVSVV